MSDKKVLSIQDISCFGQCSLTVALPVISACGIETAILPSAVLSTHTGGFKGFTFRDLTDDMPSIASHWRSEKISFDAVYTGYLGSTKQIDYVADIMDTLLEEGGKRIVDPAMADNGRLYTGFDMEFVQAMKGLCKKADIILPNITEACLLTGMEFCAEAYGKEYIDELLRRLGGLCCGKVVLTGVSYEQDKLGVAIHDVKCGKTEYYMHERIPGGSHGTGDIYASAFVGAFMRGKNELEAATIAADYTLACIRATIGDESHWYGVKFEKVLPKLMAAISD